MGPTTPRLSIAYSATRELEMVPDATRRAVGQAILSLADDFYPPGSTALRGMKGCHYLTIGNTYVLYCPEDDRVTVVAVLQGPYHPLH